MQSSRWTTGNMNSMGRPWRTPPPCIWFDTHLSCWFSGPTHQDARTLSRLMMSKIQQNTLSNHLVQPRTVSSKVSARNESIFGTSHFRRLLPRRQLFLVTLLERDNMLPILNLLVCSNRNKPWEEKPNMMQRFIDARKAALGYRLRQGDRAKDLPLPTANMLLASIR